jgi:hypothetical protein
MIATECCPAERNQRLPPTHGRQSGEDRQPGWMLNDPTLPPADKEKKK